jgi:hypothetical protein
VVADDVRRYDECPNCGYKLSREDSYCPACGQENLNKFVSLRTLFSDFLGDFFSFDSRFFRSILPFLFKPGEMTRNYLKGQRETYLPPLRILIFLCIVLLTLLSQVASREEWDTGFQGNSPITVNGLNDLDSIRQVKDSLVNFAVEKLRTDSQSVGALKILDSIAREGGLESDLLEALKLDSVAPAADDIDDNSFWGNMAFGGERLADLSEQGYSPSQIGDSLASNKGYWRKRAVVQSAKIYQSGGEGLVSFMIGNGVIIVLLAVFFLAALFKLLYIRQKRHLVEHVIFSIHMHAALVFLMIIMTTLYLFTGNYLEQLILLLIPYYLVSIRKVYQQSWGKSVFKYLLSTFVYVSFFLPVFMVVTIVISFLFF